jgi:WD40 repeat protein
MTWYFAPSDFKRRFILKVKCFLGFSTIINWGLTMKRYIAVMILIILSLCSFSTGKLPEGSVARLGKGCISNITFSPDGSILAIATALGIEFRNPTTFEMIAILVSDQVQNYICFSPDGKFLASAGGRNTLKLWDVANHNESAEIEIPNEWVRISSICCHFRISSLPVKTLGGG